MRCRLCDPSPLAITHHGARNLSHRSWQTQAAEARPRRHGAHRRARRRSATTSSCAATPSCSSPRWPAPRGLSGHTGGAYDTVPEVMIIRAFIANGAPIVPVFYDEAGHRVATQYLLQRTRRRTCRPSGCCTTASTTAGLPGHPEKGLTPGVEFSSGPPRAPVGVLQRRGDGQSRQGGGAARLRRQPDGRRRRRSRAPRRRHSS